MRTTQEREQWRSLPPPPQQETDKRQKALHFIVALGMLLISAYLIITG